MSYWWLMISPKKTGKISIFIEDLSRDLVVFGTVEAQMIGHGEGREV